MKAINCKTKDEFQRVLEIFEKKRWQWCDGDKPTSNVKKWYNYQSYTCIEYDNFFGYANMQFCKNHGFQIISFEEFLQLEGRAKSFPRVMLVYDNEDDPLSDWEELEVLGYAEGADFPWIVSNDIGKEWEYFGYKYAKEVDEKEREAIELLESKGYKVTK